MKLSESRLNIETLRHRADVLPKEHPIQAKIGEAVKDLLDNGESAVKRTDKVILESSEPYKNEMKRRKYEAIIEETRNNISELLDKIHTMNQEVLFWQKKLDSLTKK